MRKQSVLTKLSILFGKKEKSEPGISALSRKINTKGYKAKHLNTGSSKKSFLEKWHSKKEERDQKKRGSLSDLETGGRRNPVKLLLLTAVLCVGGFFLITGSLQALFGDLLYFRIHEIEISGCVVTNPKLLRKYAGITYEMNMLTIHPAGMKKNLEAHPWIERANIRRIWPDGLLVTINEYRPQALLAQADTEGFQYLDRNGLPFAAVGTGQDLDFPVITGVDVFDTEHERNELLGAAATFLRLAGQNNPSLPAQNISEIHFTSEGELILYLVQHPFPIYFGKGEIRRKFSQLHRVLKVLYRKKKGKSLIGNVAFIRMDYQKDKVLVARNHSG